MVDVCVWGGLVLRRCTKRLYIFLFPSRSYFLWTDQVHRWGWLQSRTKRRPWDKIFLPVSAAVNKSVSFLSRTLGRVCLTDTHSYIELVNCVAERHLYLRIITTFLCFVLCCWNHVLILFYNLSLSTTSCFSSKYVLHSGEYILVDEVCLQIGSWRAWHCGNKFLGKPHTFWWRRK